MQKAIISDTSCLILLTNIQELDLLHKLFGNIITTNEVADEYGLPLPSWIEIKHPKDKHYQTIIEASVDKGEASAIALAVEYEQCLLILDDLKGRKFANELGLSFIGTLGVIIDAKLAGYVKSIKPILAKIKATNFRISDGLEQIILTKAGE
jgi:predicted nucleic acid-binding protein